MREEVIRDRDGKIVQRSRNLAGIRRYVGKNLIAKLDISRTSGGGMLSLLFDNGCSFQTEFASFVVLTDFVSRWRNVYGAPLTINGVSAGVVSSDVQNAEEE